MRYIKATKMAYNYTIQFKSLRTGTVYTLSIGGGTGTAIPLTPGAQPFTTEEDSNEDEFTPVRTQSGYLRIVDDGKDANGNAWDWKDLIPENSTSRPVTLTHQDGGDNRIVDWMGFMQAQTFSGVLYGNPQEREFPVCCMLSAIEAVDFDPTDLDIKNFAWLIENVLTQTSQLPGNVIFQGGETVDDWLAKQVSCVNFANENDEGELEPRYSCLSVLQDICRFFGWTCRMYHGNVVFTMADDAVGAGFIVYYIQELSKKGNGEEYTYSEESWSSKSLDGSEFISVNNSDIALQGLRRATIEADINPVNAIVEVPYDKIEERYRANQVVQTTYGTQVTKYLFEKKQAVANEHTLSYPWLTMIFSAGGSFPGTGDQQGMTFYYFASEHIYEYYEGALNQKHSYDWQNNLFIKGDVPNDGYLLRLRTKSAYSLSGGVIVISGDSWIDSHDTNDDDAHITYVGNGHLIASLKVGDKYWNGTAWQSAWAEFEIPVGEQDSATAAQGTGGILNNRQLSSNMPNYDGFGVPVSGTVGGIVQLDIRGFYDAVQPYLHGQRGLALANLKMQFLRPVTAELPEGKTRNVYKSDGSNVFTDERTDDLIFASDDNDQFGAGIILNPDGSYCSVLEYSDESEQHPEQHTVDRMGTFGSKVRRCMQTEMLANLVGDVTPQHKVKLDSTLTHPIAISRNWGDDVVRLTLLEMPNNQNE